jgi:hypothetical protein
MASLEPYWSPLASRALTPGGRYLFALVAPGEVGGVKTNDVWVQAYLEQRGWQVVSTGAPPPEMATAVAGLAAKLGTLQNAPTPPIALKVIANWKDAKPATLPDYDGTLMYGPLAVWYSPAGPAQPPPEPAPPASAGGGGTLLLAVAAATAIVGLVWLMTRPRSAYARPAYEVTNPVKYDSTVTHRGVPIHVHQTDGGFCADYGGVLRLSRFRPAATAICDRTRERAVVGAKNHIDKILARAA